MVDGLSWAGLARDFDNVQGGPQFYHASRGGRPRPLTVDRTSHRPSIHDHGPSPIHAVTSGVRVVGFDLGERRIGVAVSDASGTLARPLKTIERGPSDAEAIERLHAMIDELAAEDAIGSVVVGLPTRLDGSPNRQTARVGAMVSLLSARLAVPVFTQDERLSSHEAEARLSLGEKDWRKRKVKLDAAAAAVILQDFLDARNLAGQRAGGSGQNGDEEETE